MIHVLSMLLIFFSTSAIAENGLHVSDLRCEYVKNPLGIETAHPRFTWGLKSNERGIHQQSYRVQVASSMQLLQSGQPDLWDSQVTNSDKSVNVAYDGKSLQSDHSYYWRVKVWDQQSGESSWSDIASFHMGMMKPSDWQGQWIGAPDTAISSPLLRRDFMINKPVASAHVFISGLGYSELYLNGDKVGNHVLDPGTSDYDKRALYETYDVTDYLNSGGNAIGVWLGNGYLRHRTTRQYADRPQLMLQMNIKYEDGSETQIVSNTSWKVAASPIMANSIYDGEIYDARREQPGWSTAGFNDQDWKNAVRLEVPDTRQLSSQLMPPIRVTQTIYPESISEPVKGVYVFDFGQNFTGWPRLQVNGGENQKVVMKSAEITRKDMAEMKNMDTEGMVDTVDTSPNRSAKARDIYILKGKPGTEVYEPRFTYHGFRYVQVEGFPGKPNLTSVAARVVHTDVPKTGSFKASNDLLNQIHENILWGQRSNLFSMPTDCPQRDERMGWMADADLSAEEAMHNFDMAAFYTNWARLIQDDQNKDGSVPDVVPHHKYGGVGTPAWQVAYPLIVWYVHEFYKDNRIIQEHYQSLKKWMDYMKSISDNYIITKGRGDWVPPKLAYAPTDGSIPITSTAYYYQSAVKMAKMAGILGKAQDQQQFSQLAENIKSAYNDRFWNPQKNSYGSGSQNSNAFSLYAGLVPENSQSGVVDNLVDNINRKHDGHIWTGILGTKALVEILPKFGHADVLYGMADKTTYPGWGYMVSKGATTLWERWGGYRYFNADMNSLNHIMFGSIDEYFYKNLAGINSDEPGFKKIRIQPRIPDDLNHAEASMKSIRGRVSSNWHREGKSLVLDVEIPGNSSAQIAVPKTHLNPPYTVNESNQVVWQDGHFQSGEEGIESAQENDDYIIFDVGSGNYHFVIIGN